MLNTILFPSSFYDKKLVDEDLKLEYEAALAVEKLEIIIFSYDHWFHNGIIKLNRIPETETLALYRGWMMLPDQYAQFFSQLLEHNIRLFTTPDMYRLMHKFPNIYPELEEDTVKILTFPLHKEIDVRILKETFQTFMVKDYVKSVKGDGFPSFFDQSITQEEFNRWMEVFYQYRGDLLTGGICIKEYIDLKRYEDRTNEHRVFYANQQILSISRNSSQSNSAPSPPRSLVEKYQYLESIFYTIDYAELEDGSWKILETGDGSVSGLSDAQDYTAFFEDLYRALNQ